jgi:hypothetical protein
MQTQASHNDIMPEYNYGASPWGLEESWPPLWCVALAASGPHGLQMAFLLLTRACLNRQHRINILSCVILLLTTSCVETYSVACPGKAEVSDYMTNCQSCSVTDRQSIWVCKSLNNSVTCFLVQGLHYEFDSYSASKNSSLYGTCRFITTQLASDVSQFSTVHN